MHKNILNLFNFLKSAAQFIKIVIAMTEEQSAEATEEYYLLFKEIQKNLIPIRENRKNDRNKYKGYNKYKQNLRRNS